MDALSADLTSSALDMTGIVDDLIYVENEPVRSIQRRMSTLQSRINAYQDRLGVRRMMLTAESQKADEALRLLTATLSALGSQIDYLSPLRNDC